MKFVNLILIFTLILCLFCIFFIIGTQEYRFYNYREIYPHLEILKKNKEKIKEEVLNLNKNNWKNWSETNLYDVKKMSWTVFPFFGFGIWIHKNCRQCPVLFNIIKNIPNLRTASLSKLGPKTKLTPHQGWANLSNYVLRCHFGIIVPDNCYIYVEDENCQQKDGEILVFDDSKTHSAENTNQKLDRIVLILDIERPKSVENGKSKVTNTKELLEIIDYFKNY